MCNYKLPATEKKIKKIKYSFPEVFSGEFLGNINR